MRKNLVLWSLVLGLLSVSSAWATEPKGEFVSEAAVKRLVRIRENRFLRQVYRRELPATVKIGLLKGQDTGATRRFAIYSPEGAPGKIGLSTVLVDMRRNRRGSARSRLGITERWYGTIDSSSVRE